MPVCTRGKAELGDRMNGYDHSWDPLFAEVKSPSLASSPSHLILSQVTARQLSGPLRTLESLEFP